MQQPTIFLEMTDKKSQRLDIALSEKTAESRSQMQKFIKKGLITVNGKKILSPHLLIKNGDKIQITPPSSSQKIPTAKMPLNVIHEDKNIIVINKPAGLIVHPTTLEDQRPTLVSGLLAAKKSLSEVAGTLKPGIVHRLDADTSGVIIIAKNNFAHKKLQQQFHQHTIKKIYLAVVYGDLKPKKGAIEAPIKRSSRDRTKMNVSLKKKAKYAISYYEVIKKSPKENISLVKVRIITGRTHQIRVHFSAIKHPVIGDKVYGKEQINKFFKDKFNLTRQLLHAQEIEFQHPRSNKTINFQAPLPKDIEYIIKTLF